MKEKMTQKEDNLVTWFFMVALLLGVLAWAGNNQSFEDRCKTECAPARYITPLYQFEQACFCDEGHGKWRITDIGNNR